MGNGKLRANRIGSRPKYSTTSVRIYGTPAMRVGDADGLLYILDANGQRVHPFIFQACGGGRRIIRRRVGGGE